MATMVLDRAALPEQLSSYFRAPRIAAVWQSTGDVMLSPVIDPADYDNDTDYLNAIPGMREKIIEGLNTPLEECIPLEEIWPDV